MNQQLDSTYGWKDGPTNEVCTSSSLTKSSEINVTLGQYLHKQSILVHHASWETTLKASLIINCNFTQSTQQLPQVSIDTAS